MKKLLFFFAFFATCMLIACASWAPGLPLASIYKTAVPYVSAVNGKPVASCDIDKMYIYHDPESDESVMSGRDPAYMTGYTILDIVYTFSFRYAETPRVAFPLTVEVATALDSDAPGNIGSRQLWIGNRLAHFYDIDSMPDVASLSALAIEYSLDGTSWQRAAIRYFNRSDQKFARGLVFGDGLLPLSLAEGSEVQLRLLCFHPGWGFATVKGCMATPENYFMTFNQALAHLDTYQMCSVFQFSVKASGVMRPGRSK